MNRTFATFFRPTSPVSASELTLNGIGVRERMVPCVIDRPQGTGDYLIMYFHQPMRLGTRDGIQEVKQRSVIIWPPGEAQYYGHDGAEWVHSWMHVEGEFVDRLIARTGLVTNWPIACATPRIVSPLLTIYDEVTREGGVDVVIVKNLLENWLRDLARTVRGDSSGGVSVPASYLRLKRWMEQHFAEAGNLGDLAARIPASTSHFSAQFKEFFGTSPIAYLIELRMGQALYLLRDRNLSVTDVAYRVGYNDLYYFSKQFKAYHGASPRAMRKRLLGP